MKWPTSLRSVSIIAACCIAALALMFLPGCAADDIATAKAAIPQVQAEVEKTQVALDEAQAQIVIAKEKGEDTSGAEKVVTAMQKALTVANDTLTKLNNVVANATSTADLIEAGGKEAASFVPGGYGPLVALAATTVASLWRASANRTAARNIAYAIEQAKQDNKIDFASPETQTRLSSNMGATAKRIVDEAQGNATPLPI